MLLLCQKAKVLEEGVLHIGDDIRLDRRSIKWYENFMTRISDVKQLAFEEVRAETQKMMLVQANKIEIVSFEIMTI